jgi:hypothetical protein
MVLDIKELSHKKQNINKEKVNYFFLLELHIIKVTLLKIKWMDLEFFIILKMSQPTKAIGTKEIITVKVYCIIINPINFIKDFNIKILVYLIINGSIIVVNFSKGKNQVEGVYF